MTEDDILKFLRGHRATEQAVRWSLSSWTDPSRDRLAPYFDFLSQLGSEWAGEASTRGGPYRDVHRSDLYRLRDDMELFVGTMVWGFGPDHRGPARTDQMLSTENAADLIADIVSRARTASLEDAFSGLFDRRGRGRIFRLGTAYGTKVLHVAGHTRTDGEVPIVYDKRVWTSLSNLESYPGPTPMPTDWVSAADYSLYCRWAAEFANRATLVIGEPCKASDIEYALFCLADHF